MRGKIKIFKTIIPSLMFLTLISCDFTKPKEFKQVEKAVAPILAPRFNLEIENYCVPQTTKRVSFNVISRNYHLTSAGIVSDMDGDGVSDKDETSKVAQLFGISPTRYDTNGDGYNDSIVYYGLITLPQQGTFPPCGIGDLDFDGLPDCAENIIGTDPSAFDTDKDGIPDELELFVGLNPLNKDSHVDSDMDGVTNFEEMVYATPLNEQNKLGNINTYKLKYDLKSISSSSSGVECFTYSVKNIVYQVARAQNNMIEIYFMEEIGGKTKLKKFDRLILQSELDILSKDLAEDELPTFKIQYSDLGK